MTNKEWMSTLPAEQFYDEMIWLGRVFGFRFNNTRLGIIAWLDEPHESEGADDFFTKGHLYLGYVEGER